MAEKPYRQIVDHYEGCLPRHGDNHRGVDWPRAEDVATRHAVMLGVIRPGDRLPVRLLDFGCGAGHLYDSLRRGPFGHVAYRGLDLSERFVALCRSKYPGVPFDCLDVLDDGAELPEFDYAVLNGVFTEKRGLSFAEMFDYARAVLRRLFARATAGVAFNVMSKQVDWERDDLFHLPFDDLAAFLSSQLSRHFVLRHEYGLYEYTAYVYRETLRMARVIVFGLKDFASLAHYYLRHDSPHEVVAFTVTRDHLPADPAFEGKPVVPFEDLERHYPPDDFRFFAPMSYRGMNRAREGVFLRARARGYRCISYVSSRAKVYPNVPVGENCFILDDNTVQPFCRIGDNVVLWARNGIGHHTTVGDHAFLTGNVIVPGHCLVGRYCFLGVSSTLRDGLTLGEGTLLGMGSCLTRDTKPWGVYKGNPAREYRMKSTEVRV